MIFVQNDLGKPTQRRWCPVRRKCPALQPKRVFRFAADRVTAALAQCGDVEAIALIGSVGRPLRREVPRFAPYKQLRLPVAHECKDVDLAAWVPREDGVDELRPRSRAIKEIVAERGHGPA